MQVAAAEYTKESSNGDIPRETAFRTCPVRFREGLPKAALKSPLQTGPALSACPVRSVSGKRLSADPVLRTGDQSRAQLPPVKQLFSGQ